MFSNELDAQVGDAGGVAAWMAQTRDLEAQAAARALGLQMHIVQAERDIFASLARLGVGALVVLPNAAMREPDRARRHEQAAASLARKLGLGMSATRHVMVTAKAAMSGSPTFGRLFPIQICFDDLRRILHCPAKLKP